MEALEALDGLESSLQLLVVALDEVRGSRAVRAEPIFRAHVAGEEIAVLEDMLEGRNLHRVVLVPWESPADVTFEVLFPKEGMGEDVLLKVCEETPVGFLAPNLEGSSDVLEEVDVTELDDDVRKDVSGCHSDGFVIVAGDGDQRVIRILEFLEVLHPGLKALGGSEEADRDVVGQVINAVEERNLPFVALHRNVLSVHNERSSESLAIAVPGSDVVVMGEDCEFSNELPVSSTDALGGTACECANARAFEVQRQDGFGRLAMIGAEPATAIIALVAIDASPQAFLLRPEATAVWACEMASVSVFFGVNMFKGGKVAS